MKTIFNSKTENTVKKSTSKWLVVILSIALISSSLDAQNLGYSYSEKMNFAENTYAMYDANVSLRSNSGNHSAFLASVETEQEESLQIENWMLDNTYFRAYDLIIAEEENPMEIERWMTNEMNFGSVSLLLEPAVDEDLEIEKWMTNEHTFSNLHLLAEQESENKLEVENWMLNTDLFLANGSYEAPLTIENWMVSEQIWK